MKQVTKVFSTVFYLSLLILLVRHPVKAASGGVVVSEVLFGASDSASKEFIELYNNSSQKIDVSKWALEYKSATGKTWLKKATFASRSIEAHEYILVSTEGTADLHLTSGMAQTGGNLRLVSLNSEVFDQFAWGDGDAPEKQTFTSVSQGKSVARGLTDSGDSLLDTDDNSADFHVSLSPTPGQSPAMEHETVVEPPDVPPGETSSDIILSELLPDPVSPLTDSKDEFIELYNTGEVEVNLAGWSLRDASGHTFKIIETTVQPHAFAIFKSAQTKISLNNDGDTISLLDSNGSEVDTSPNYEQSKAGLSWGLVDGGWDWTQVPTPGASNAAAFIEPVKETASTKNVAATKSTKLKATTAKKPAAKTSKAAKAASSGIGSNYGLNNQASSSSPVWSWLLIVFGVGTIGYGAYAYKPEITHFIHKLRAKPKTR